MTSAGVWSWASCGRGSVQGRAAADWGNWKA